MADGSQQGFNFPRTAIFSALQPDEITVDFFAGGGGASEAMEQATGRPVDIAVNHDHLAIGMHAANHPFTQHMEADVWAVNILREVAGRSVGWFHASPDCTDHSQAKGGQPRDRATRSLTWVVKKVAGTLARHGLAPRIISLENVKQILKWCPLVAKRDPVTGRVVTLDVVIDPITSRKAYRVAEPGERVPLQNQYLVPDKRRVGKTWKQFVTSLRDLGYVVEWRVLRADAYGAGTDRERLYMIARRDGAPIAWPEPTHGHQPGQEPPMCGADSIIWTLLGHSIFNRPRPLRPNTIIRLLDGARRAAWPEPYIAALEALRDGRSPRQTVTAAEAEAIAQAFGHQPGLIMATGSGGVARPVQRPIPTITTGGNGAAPHFIRPIIVYKHESKGGRQARPVDEPLPTVTQRGAGFLAEPIIAPYYGSGSGRTGQRCSRKLPTVTTKARFGLAEPVIISTCNSSARGVRLSTDKLRTITTARGGDQALGEPVLQGFEIDILYRMLVERELFNATGFRPDYIIDRTARGERLTRAAGIRMVGNAVSPKPLAAIIRVNLDSTAAPERLAA
jgi:DNA (cytosine-5)-methyltransferase 1